MHRDCERLRGTSPCGCRPENRPHSGDFWRAALLQKPMRRELVCMVMLVGCGSGGDATDGASGNGGGPEALSGTIAGSPWEVSAAYTDSFLSNDQDAWVVLLGNDDTGSCDAPNISLESAKLQLRVPLISGEYALDASSNRRVNLFIPPSTSSSLSVGTVTVEAVSATALVASLSIADTDVVLDGFFAATICP